MKEILEGRRIGFAFRPPLAAIAAGLAASVTLLDLAAWFGWGARETNGFVVASYWLCIATAVVALLALLTAAAELRDVPDEERTLARLDGAATLLAILLYGASAAIRSFELGAAGATPIAFLMTVAGLIVVLVAAATSSLLYAAREWEEIEELQRDHGRHRAVSR